MWKSYLSKRQERQEEALREYYKSYDQKYPWLWELIDRFKRETPESFEITREQYHVLVEEPCIRTDGWSPYTFPRCGQESEWEGGEFPEWVAKTNLNVPIYIEGYAPPKQLELDMFGPPKQLKLVL